MNSVNICWNCLCQAVLETTGFLSTPWWNLLKTARTLSILTTFSTWWFIYLWVYISLFFLMKKWDIDGVRLFLSVSLRCHHWFFETVQLFTGLGGCDGTDFVCNFFGGAVGFIIISVLRLLMKKHYNLSLNLVNVVCLIGFVPVSVYFLVNTILSAGQYAPILWFSLKNK